MRLIRDEIISVGETSQYLVRQSGAELVIYNNPGTGRISTANIPYGRDEDELVRAYTEIMATADSAKDAESVIIPKDTAKDMFQAVMRSDEEGRRLPFRLPFDPICFEFSEPIKESTLFEWEGLPFDEATLTGETEGLGILKHDKCLALVVDGRGEDYVASVFFESYAVNVCRFTERGEVVYDNKIAPPDATFVNEKHENKKRIAKLAIGLVALINAANVTLVRKGATQTVNRKRIRMGKRMLPDYYVTDIRHATVAAKPGAIGTGRTQRLHSVRGHWRHLSNNSITWVKPHLRGFSNAQSPKGERTHYELKR